MHNQALLLIRFCLQNLGRKYYLYLFSTLLFSFLHLLPPQLFQYFSRYMESSEQLPLNIFIRNIVLFALCIGLTMAVGTFIQIVFHEWQRLMIGKLLKLKAVESIQNLDLDKLKSESRGEWLMRLSNDLQSTEGFLTDALPHQLQDLFTFIGVAALFIYHTGPLAIIVLFFELLIMFFNFKMQKKISPILNETRELRSLIFQNLIENLEGIKTIRSRENFYYIEENFKNKIQHIISKGLNVVKTIGLFLAASEIYTMILTLSILLFMIYLIKGQSLTLSEVLVYPFYMSIFFNSGRGLVSAGYEWNRFLVDGNRLAKLLLITPELSHHKADKNDIFNSINDASVELEIKNISLQFNEGPIIINNIDLKIKSFEMLIITGESGKGKSTLLEFLAGLRKGSADSVLVNNKNIKHTNDVFIPRALSLYVEQVPFIFSDTLRENLTMGECFPDEELIQILIDLGLWELFNSKKGLDTYIFDRGNNLSEGQKYRLCLARSLLVKRPFLLLDEPFAALDEFSIALVCKTLNKQKNKGQGLIVVTHTIPEDLAFTNQLCLF